MEEETKKRTSKSVARKMVLTLLILAIVSAATVSVVRQKPELVGLSKGESQVESEVADLLAEVGTLITLPSDENPTVATVTDAEKIKEQVFFKNAQNGDRVIIYTKARKVILYRPTEKKIIDVGAVNIQQSQSPAPSGSASPSATNIPAPTASPDAGE